MCIEKDLQKKQQNVFQQTVFQQEEQVKQFQNNLQFLQNVQKETQEQTRMEQVINAQLVSGQIPAAGVVAPAPQQAALLQKKIAPKNKKERALQRQREEEKQRYKEEIRKLREESEEQRHKEEIRKLREADARRDEEKRMQRRKLLFDDPEILTLMGEYAEARTTLTRMGQDAQKADEELVMQKATNLLRTASQKLLENDQELIYINDISIDHESQTVTPFRMLIATQVEDVDTANELQKEAKDHRDYFAELAKERPVISLANRELLNILKEECEADSTLTKAADQMAEQYNERSNIQQRRWLDFETAVAQKIHMRSEDDEKSINLMKSGGPFHYLAKSEAIEKFQDQTQELMQKDTTLTRDAAEEQVLAKQRKELREGLRKEAQKRSMDNGVVSGISVENWKQYGGVSYHQTLLASEAYKMVSKSDGFLYAKPVGNGLCELRPTLPKTVELNGELIPLRRTYTLLIKAMMHRVLDENGDLRENAEKLAGDIASLDEEVIKTELLQILANDTEQVDQTMYYLKKFIDASNGIRFLPSEILGDFENAIRRISATGASASAAARFEEVREKMLEEGCSKQEIEETMKQLVEPSLVERQYWMREKFLEENNGAPLTEKQEEQIRAVASMYADMDAALREMYKIRAMDPDSPDVPLPNACSAHALFIRNIRTNIMKRGNDFPLVYYYQMKNSDMLNPASTQENQKIEYEYHAAANLGITENGVRITSEGFAAGEKQYMVSPFSCQHAVGLYHGKETLHHETETFSDSICNDGMTAYYDKDQALLTDSDMIFREIKEKLSFGQLPKPQYRSRIGGN